MTDNPRNRRAAFREAIERFLQERLEGKLEKLKPDDPKRDQLRTQFAFATWIEDAARRVGQLQMATHIAKATYPEAKIDETTSLYVRADSLRTQPDVGSHVLGTSFAEDVVGNSAALDVFAFLQIQVDGKPLLQAILSRDADLIHALSDDQNQATQWAAALAVIVEPRSPPASHSRTKQLYWLAKDDPRKNSHYVLLAPLFSSSLVHKVFESINEDRFGESAKVARQARRDGKPCDTGYREYPHLAIRQLGGSNTQNIGRLNNLRQGRNYLLASLPPNWKSRDVREPYNAESVFPRFGARTEVRQLVRGLNKFLASNPDPTVATRQRREAYVDGLTDELVLFAAELQTALPAGWSLDTKCRLVPEEQLWLDPARAEEDEAFRERWQRMDWPDAIGRRFGNWLNSKLAGKLPVGDAEQRQWTHELTGHTEWAARIDQGRRQLDQQQRGNGGAS